MSNSNLVIIKYSGKLLYFVHTLLPFIIFEISVFLSLAVCVCVFTHKYVMLYFDLLCYVFFSFRREKEYKIHIKSNIERKSQRIRMRV